MSRTTKAALQSPPPLVTNDAAVAIVGTGIWVAALIGLLLSRSWLRQHDALWWIWVAVAGIAAGLIWGPYAIWRRRGFLREAGISEPGGHGGTDRSRPEDPDV